jgi:hypothetical protein
MLTWRVPGLQRGGIRFAVSSSFFSGSRQARFQGSGRLALVDDLACTSRRACRRPEAARTVHGTVGTNERLRGASCEQKLIQTPWREHLERDACLVGLAQ